MKTNFEKALEYVLESEGGLTNDKHDPGGLTNFGIIQTEYNSYRRLKGEFPQSVASISKAEYEEIYKTLYWDKVCADRLPSGLDYAVFDFAVNSGVHQASKTLQRLVNQSQKRSITVDGNIGSATIDAVTDIDDLEPFLLAYCDARLSFLKRLKTWVYFGKGWGTRVRKVKRNSLLMLKDHTPSWKPPVPNLGASADEPEKPKSAATSLSIGAVVSSVAAGLSQQINSPYALAALVVVLALGTWFAIKKLS